MRDHSFTTVASATYPEHVSRPAKLAHARGAGPATGGTFLDTIWTAERLHLAPITTPAASPQSHGMSEAFVNTLKRDYVSAADRSAAAALLEAISAWIADYNAVAPQPAFGFRSPSQYKAEMLAPALAGLTG